MSIWMKSYLASSEIYLNSRRAMRHSSDWLRESRVDLSVWTKCSAAYPITLVSIRLSSLFVNFWKLAQSSSFYGKSSGPWRTSSFVTTVYIAPHLRTLFAMAITDSPYKLDKPERVHDLLKAERGDDCAGCRVVGKSLHTHQFPNIRCYLKCPLR